MENFVLVQIGSPDNSKRLIRVIRTYLSKPRAEQDCALLQEVNTFEHYEIQTVEHIDD